MHTLTLTDATHADRSEYARRWSVLAIVLVAALACSLFVVIPSIRTASSASSSTPDTAMAARPPIANPVTSSDSADPDVLYADGRYWAFVTNHDDAHVPVMSSTDLQHWSPAGDALPQLPIWAEPNRWLAHRTWAPAILPIAGGYLLYYTAGVQGLGRQCISVAFSRHVAGPYRDTSTRPLVCQLDLGGSIDPEVFVDPDGSRYLVWKNDGNCCALPTRIWSQRLADDGRSLIGDSTELLRNAEPWEGGNIEAPELVHAKGRYYLLYSANRWDSAHYAVGIATCDGPAGPCTRISSEPFIASDGDMAGPGGTSVFTDADGEWWVAMHAWPADRVATADSARQLWIAPLEITSDRVTAEVDGTAFTLPTTPA